MFKTDSYNQARRDFGFSHAEVAAKAGLPASTVANWRDQSAEPSAAGLLALAQVLGLRPEELVQVEIHPRSLNRRRDLRQGLDGLARVVGRPVNAALLARARLTDHESFVLSARFGLAAGLRGNALGGPPQTLIQLARDLGLTKQRIHQIEASALAKLKFA